MIKFDNVSKRYKNDIEALKNVSFEIKDGEFVFIVGASGAGKSTIAKLIFREEVCNSGSIVVNHKDLSKMRRRQIPYYRREIGFVFQDFRLLNNKDVYDNVAFAMHVIGASKREIKERVPKILERVNLTERQNNLPQQLSGGEQQRVSLARSLVNSPPIILADEPTGNLDDETSWEIVRMLDELNRQGATIIMVTHAMNIVRKMNKRVIRLNKGVVVSDGFLTAEEKSLSRGAHAADDDQVIYDSDAERAENQEAGRGENNE